MTPYQLGYAMGLRTRVARAPILPTRADVARWRSGFYDASADRHARRANEARTLRTFGFQSGAW